MDDYYPFGLTFNSYERENSTPNQYQYNGKEKQDELGLDWLDYGLRMYDPACGCWHNIDPVADAYYSNSPYSYVLGNPVSNKDVHGMWTVSRHHRMTLDALSSVGLGGEQARLIAHYASVYADNPGGHIALDNMVNPTSQTMYYRDDIDYSRTANSQQTGYAGVGYNYNIWHSMRSGTEKHAHEKGSKAWEYLHKTQ